MPLTPEEAQAFIATQHAQGAADGRLKTLNLGLFNQEELVGVIQFCSPRTSGKKRTYSSELLRLAFKENVRVVGGASKLVDYYRRTYDPTDFFTYQDTTGENTSVYEHCGMTLVAVNKTKSYLVAPGKTLATASRKAGEVLSLAYALRLGPDAILGTTLGHGEGKTNLDLFLSLGWTKEDTSGDKVYEWVNPERTFYTYKVTASDSKKYYYGVRTVKKGGLTKEDCLQDSYWGSGGKHAKNNKFTQWKSRHSHALKKEILDVFSRKLEAYNHERDLVGDKWKTDALCLNSVPGGYNGGIAYEALSLMEMKTCPHHGQVLHRGDACVTCISLAGVKKGTCPKHGEGKFRGDNCYRCLTEGNYYKSECSVHGIVLHQGSKCVSCANESVVSVKNCPTHGSVKHQGEKCSTCTNEALIALKVCAVHGETPHRSHTCMKCVAEKIYSEALCPVHGLTAHQGTTCAKCKLEQSVSLEECPLHGRVKHLGGNCYLCQAKKNVTLKDCPTHGLTKHLGSKCYKCRASKFTQGECPIHGLGNHQGGKCFKCTVSQRTRKTKTCLLCHEEFEATNGRQKICLQEHLVPCPECGNDMVYHSKKKTCSITCGLKKSKREKAARERE